MMKKNRRILSLLLVVSLLFSSSALVSAEPAQTEEAEVVRLGEVESLRETNSQTYLLSDGSYECVVYAEDKFYLDESDSLQLIDNSIKAETTALSTTYKNTANVFDVTFSDDSTPEVSIALDGKSVTFSPLNASGGTGNHIVAEDCVALVGKVNNCQTLDTLTSTGSNTVTYEDAFTNTDLVYVLENHALKEYIILNSASAPNEFSFLFSMEGLTMQTEDGQTYLADEDGTAVFGLADLFAIDAENAMTEGVAYSFVPVKGTANVIVTVTLDEDYLTAPERVFPVVIDPSVMISSYMTADTWVSSYYPSTNYYLSSYLRTGACTDYGIRRSYIQFDIPFSVDDGDITSASLDIEMESGATPNVKAYCCANGWSSSTITWNTQMTYNYDVTSSVAVPRSSGSAWYTMDVTDMVQRWADNYYVNYGFMLKDTNESDTSHWTKFYSSDADSPHKPELHIYYGEYPEDPDPTPTLTLNRSSMSLDVGTSESIIVIESPGGTVTWSSVNTSVATVSSNGVVTARGLGSVTIIASANGYAAYCTVYVTIPDGTYFIRNKYSDKYADIAGGSMASGTAIQQQTYDGEDTQRWKITHLGECVYSIRSANSTSAYYMGVNGDSTAANQPVVLDTSLSRGSRWKIWKTSSGAYKLVPLTGESSGYALALASTSTSDAVALRQRAYTNDTNYSDEWLLYQNNPCNISVYFSDAYESKKGSASAAAAAIAGELEELKDKYLELFHISLDFGTPTNMTTYADACPDISGGASACNCTNDSGCSNTWDGSASLHHTNFYNIKHNITAPSGSVDAKIVYLGHVLCRRSGGVHITSGGTTDTENNIILLSTMETDTMDLSILVHEVGHMFGAPDHYDLEADGGGDGNYTNKEANEVFGGTFSDDCIYGRNRVQAASSLTICVGCQEQIRKNANKYYEEP